MKEFKQIICCLLVGLMLINPSVLCVAAAEETAQDEVDAILQMEPVQVADTSATADTPTDIPAAPDVVEVPVETPVEASFEIEVPIEAPAEADVLVDGEMEASSDGNTPEDIPAVCDLSDTESVTTMEELKEAISNAVTGDTINLDASSGFIVDESITIPSGVYLNVQSGSGGFTIAEGVTFTTTSQFDCRVPMTVAGTWRSKDNSYCYGGLQITTTGCVVNAFYLRIINSYKNDGIFSISSGGSTYLELNVDDLSELKAALGHDNPGHIDIYLRMTGNIILTEDLTIPDTISLHISEGASFTVSQDVTLTTNGYFGCDILMTVAGMWINKTQSYCKGNLTIATTGTLENYGTINVNGAYTVDGTVIESGSNRVYVNHTVNSMEELLAVVTKVHNGDSIWISYSEEPFYIDQSVTLPESVVIHVDCPIVVNEGVTLTTMSNCDFYYPVTIAGTWQCNDYSYCNGGLQITSTGHVENNWALSIYNYYNNQGIFSAESYASTYLTYYISGEQVLSESVDLPEIFRLLIMPEASGAALTIAEGVTLTTFGSFDCRVPLTVAGTWISNTDSSCREGLTITSTGKVDNASGQLHVEGFSTNEGILISQGWGALEHATLATTPDELAAAASHTLTGGTIWVSGDGGDFVVDESLMIPAGVTVAVYKNIQNLCINAELTIDAGATLHSDVPTVVKGSIHNYGAIEANSNLDIQGKIHNYAYIRVNGALTGETRIVDYEAASRSVYQAYTVDSEAALRDVLKSLDAKKWNDIFVPNGLTLTENTTIPAGVYLEIQSGIFTVGDDATLITNDNLCVYGDMVVNGYWENRTTNYGGYCGVHGVLTANHVIKNSGYIELYQYCQALEDSLINNFAGGRVYCAVTIASQDELYSFADGKSYLPVTVSVKAPFTLTLDRDLTIPDGMRLCMWDVDLVVPEGVTLTICDADVNLGNLHIEGTLVNDGELSVSNITLLGTIENTYSICFGELVNYGVGHVKNGGVLRGSIDEQCIIEKTERTTGPKCFYYSVFETCDWNDIFANAQSGDSFYCNGYSDNAWITISGNILVPEDVTISGGRYKIAEDAVFVTNGTNFSASDMQVDGSWINNGSVDANNLTVNGLVHNFGQISSSTVTGAENVMGNAVALPSPGISYTTILNLQDMLDIAEPGSAIGCYSPNGDSTIINRDIVVPEGVTLVFSGVSKVYLTAGHTLTVNGTLLVQQELYVAGKLVVNGNVTIDSDDSGSYFQNQFGITLGSIHVTSSGSYALNGSIRVAKYDYAGQSVSDPCAALTGMEAASLSVQETDRYWYLSPDEGAVLCTVTTDGCTLRLLDGDNCVWQAVSISDGTVIPGMTASQYTLEVSKSGYVTRQYTLDTADMGNTLAVELVAVGNINGTAVNEKDVEITDLACLYTYLTTGDHSDSSIEDEAYFMAVADINGDGAVDVYDLQRLYEHLSGINTL